MKAKKKTDIENMVVVALTNLKPVTIRSIEVSTREEAYDLYSQNPNFVIAIINNEEVLILGSEVQKDAQFQILKQNGYIFEGKKVRYLCEDLKPITVAES